MMRGLLLYLLMISATSWAGAQEVSFSAKSNLLKVPKGGVFQVEFTLSNAQGSGFIPPDFKGFKIVSGPAQSYRTSIINGKRSSSVGFAYTLLAQSEGHHTIEAATIKVNGKTVASNSIKMEVLPNDTPVTTLDQEGELTEIFLLAYADTSKVYIGQQVVVYYKLYTKINVENYNIISESEYNGCYAQSLDAYREPVLKETVNGEEYSTKVLRKVAVFPQQSGKIEIEPLYVKIGIPKRDPRFRGFFSSFNLRTENLSSNTLTLNVSSPFENAPESFSGGVGQFQVDFQMSRTTATTDDALALRILIRGNGDIKTIRSPKLQVPEAFELFDAKVTNERMINATDSVRGEKTFEIISLIDQPGNYKFAPEFTYFDPKLDSFITVRDSFSLLINPGRRSASARADNDLEPSLSDELEKIKMSTRVYRMRPILSSSPLYWGAYLLPILGFIFFGWYERSRGSEDVVDVAQLAQRQLDDVAIYLEQNDAGKFYEGVAMSLKRFISRKFDVDASEFSRQKIQEVLEKGGLDHGHRNQVDELLAECDFALYSGSSQAQQMQSTYEEAVEVLSLLIKQI